MASFCNERTVEIAIASQLRILFGAGGRRVIPIHFWASREGSKAASEIHAGIPFRLLALFVRRPKLSSLETSVDGKLNIELLQFARVAKRANIPTVAVFPCAPNLLDLVDDPALLFLGIPDEGEDIYFSVRLEEGSYVVTSEVMPLLIEPSTIVQCVYQNQAPATLDTWARIIKQVRREVPEQKSWFPWGRSTYKPLYLLLADESLVRARGMSINRSYLG